MPEHEVRTCKRGHPRTPENVNPSYHCRACKAAWEAAHYDREKQAAKKAAWRNRLSAPQYALLLLKARRYNALRRMAGRHSREEAS